jgi:hypothetical protein
MQDGDRSNLPAVEMPTERRGAALTPLLPPALRRVLAFAIEAQAVAVEAGGGVRIVERPDWTPPSLDDETRGSAESWRRRLDRHLVPADPERLGFAVGRLLAHRWRGRAEELSEGAQQAILTDWIDDLGEFPLWAVDEAMRTYRRTEEWAPTIAAIRRLCEAEVSEDRRTLRLLGKLLAGQA